MKKNLSRMLSLMLAVFVAFGMICFGTGEAKAETSWNLSVGDTYYAGDPKSFIVEVMDWDTNETAAVTSAKSSNSKVIKIEKYKYDGETQYTMKFKKAGKAKITVKYKTPSGSKGTLTKTIKVKKYPNPIKSLKVNGKKVKISSNKFNYDLTAYKKTSAKIKLTPSSGWKIGYVSGVAYKWSSGKTKEIKISKSKIKNGKSISVPKGYDYIDVNIQLVKGNEDLSYFVSFDRN